MDAAELAARALAEDVGPGDVTTDACIDAGASGRARIVAKQELVVAGHEVAAATFRHLGEVAYEIVVPDGTGASPGDVIARVEGPYRALLTGERVALNLLMRLSGIATHTRAYVAAAQGKLRVVDTRKTTPLLRRWEKHAVRCGGGHNHRFALYDGAMIKDNHIAAAGGIAPAVRRVREAAHHLVRIEVEVEGLDQLREALDAGADVVLLDNMDDAALAEAVRVTREIRPEVVIEASGNMTPERIAAIRDLGLDVVSAGGLVHQARWVDLSMRIDV